MFAMGMWPGRLGAVSTTLACYVNTRGVREMLGDGSDWLIRLGKCCLGGEDQAADN